MAQEQDEAFEVTADSIKPYFMGKKFHKRYWTALDYYRHMAFHFEGYFVHVPTNDQQQTLLQKTPTENSELSVYFNRLIDMRRPSESPEIQSYRRLTYLPITKQPCFKVYNALRKIVKADDWKIDYSKVSKPAGIADGEYLGDYCEKNYPRFNSLENWAYNYGIKNILVDANALIYVLPEHFDIEPTEYYKPVATIINCKEVLDYKENEYAIFVCEHKSEYYAGKVKQEGKVIGIITRTGYWEASQINNKLDFELEEKMSYEEMKFLPAWLTGGVVKKLHRHYTLSESFLAPMLPGLDGMAQASSDENAEWVQHIYTTMWYITQQECKACNGTGKVQRKGGSAIECTKCKGEGIPTKSNFKDLVIKMGALDGTNTPTPPAGILQKSTEIVKVFEARINKLEWRALGAVNHEFLAETPLVQSGKAKDSDRQELLNYTYAVAYHIVENIMSDIYYFINEFRYMNLITNEEVRKEMLPKLAIPVQYDLTTEADISEQIKSAKDNNLDPELISAWEIEYMAKKFPNNLELRDKLKCIKQFDPFPGMTNDEKNNMLLSKSATTEDVILSNYIYPFVERAIMEDETFLEKDYEEKLKVFEGYVAEKVKKLSAADKLKQKQNPTGGQVEDPNNPGFDMNGQPMKKVPPVPKK